eukprot:403364328
MARNDVQNSVNNNSVRNQIIGGKKLLVEVKDTHSRIIEESQSSQFYSEEGFKDFTDSSFSSMTEETPISNVFVQDTHNHNRMNINNISQFTCNQRQEHPHTPIQMIVKPQEITKQSNIGGINQLFQQKIQEKQQNSQKPYTSKQNLSHYNKQTFNQKNQEENIKYNNLDKQNLQNIQRRDFSADNTINMNKMQQLSQSNQISKLMQSQIYHQNQFINQSQQQQQQQLPPIPSRLDKPKRKLANTSNYPNTQMNASALLQITQSAIVSSNNPQLNQSEVSRRQPIVMQSMSLIQKSRAEIQNRSNSQSIRDTIVSNQKQQQNSSSNVPTNLQSIVVQIDQPIYVSTVNTNSASLVRVSEQQSENCSIIDEHETTNMNIIADNSQSSSGSKNSDKENSNIRINQETSQVNCEEALPHSRSSIHNINRHVTPTINKSKTKVGLSDKQSKNIRQAPVFKGLQSVLQQKLSGAGKEQRSQHNKQIYSNSTDNSQNQQKLGKIDQINGQNMKEVSTRLSKQFKQVIEKTQNKPIVLTSIEQPSVYHIIGNNQEQGKVKDKRTTPKSAMLKPSSRRSPKSRNNPLKHIKFQEDSLTTQIGESKNILQTDYNRSYDNNLMMTSQQVCLTDTMMHHTHKPSLIHRPQIMDPQIRLRKQIYLQQLPHSIEYEQNSHSYLNTDGNQPPSSQKRSIVSQQIRQQQFSLGSSIQSYNQSIMPQYSPMYSNSNVRSEFQSIISNPAAHQNGTQNYHAMNNQQNLLRSQLSLIDEEPGRRINTDPNANNFLYPHLSNQRSLESLYSINENPHQQLQKSIGNQHQQQNAYKFAQNQNIPTKVSTQNQQRQKISDPSNQQLTVNDFIDFNEINEGIVYIEGGIGLHKSQNQNNSQQLKMQQQNNNQRSFSSNRNNLIQNAQQLNNMYFNGKEQFQVNQGYINMGASKNHQQRKISMIERPQVIDGQSQFNNAYYTHSQQMPLQTNSHFSAISTATDNNPKTYMNGNQVYLHTHSHNQNYSNQFSSQQRSVKNRAGTSSNFIYCETDPVMNQRSSTSKSNKRQDLYALNNQKQYSNPNDKYIEQLKKMMIQGKNNIDPNSSSEDEDENDQDCITNPHFYHHTEINKHSNKNQKNIINPKSNNSRGYSDTENEQDLQMGQKIFFTEGGRTNKQSKKMLLEQAQIKKKGSQGEQEANKQSKCLIF